MNPNLTPTFTAYFIPFRYNVFYSITTETIRLQKPRLIGSQSDIAYLRRILSKRLTVADKQVVKFSAEQVRLCLVGRNAKDDKEETIWVDKEGVVKTGREEYLLTPGAFLDLSELLHFRRIGGSN